MSRRFFEALIAFSLLLLFSIYLGSIPNQPSQGAEYTWVDSHTLIENPSLYENRKVTTHVTITNVVHEGNVSFHDSKEGITLVLFSHVSPPSIGDSVLVRGILRFNITPQIEVVEFYVMDEYSSLLRSIPGILLFAILFFSFFKIDFRKLVFTTRGDLDA